MSIGPEGSRNAGSDQTRSVSKACRHPEDSEARTGGILPQGADLKLSLRGCWGSKLNMGQIGIEPNRWVASRPLEAYVPISVDRHIPRSSRH